MYDVNDGSFHVDEPCIPGLPSSDFHTSECRTGTPGIIAHSRNFLSLLKALRVNTSMEVSSTQTVAKNQTSIFILLDKGDYPKGAEDREVDVHKTVVPSSRRRNEKSEKTKWQESPRAQERAFSTVVVGSDICCADKHLTSSKTENGGATHVLVGYYCVPFANRAFWNTFPSLWLEKTLKYCIHFIAYFR